MEKKYNKLEVRWLDISISVILSNNQLPSRSNNGIFAHEFDVTSLREVIFCHRHNDDVFKQIRRRVFSKIVWH